MLSSLTHSHTLETWGRPGLIDSSPLTFRQLYPVHLLLHSDTIVKALARASGYCPKDWLRGTRLIGMPASEVPRPKGTPFLVMPRESGFF